MPNTSTIQKSFTCPTCLKFQKAEIVYVNKKARSIKFNDCGHSFELTTKRNKNTYGKKFVHIPDHLRNTVLTLMVVNEVPFKYVRREWFKCYENRNKSLKGIIHIHQLESFDNIHDAEKVYSKVVI